MSTKNIIISLKQNIKPTNNGFTLVELSIVLVIIGLIMGGIMTGRDMIKAATIRAQIAQLQNYKTAAYSFKDKYGKLPGDIYPSIATKFGFVTRAGTTSRGNGNGNVTGGCGVGHAGMVSCETALFWRDLSEAKMIKEVFNTAIDDYVTAAAGTVTDYIPEAKIKGNNIRIGNFSTQPNLALGINMGNVMIIEQVSSIAAGTPSIAYTVTPQEALDIDSKIDDGLPLDGTVFENPWLGSAAPAVGVCASSATTPATYNTTTPAYAGSGACSLWFKY